MTFEEWIVKQYGPDHGFTASEIYLGGAAFAGATAAERERCAKVCEKAADEVPDNGDTEWINAGLACAAAIRATP
jgi:hypothetical protein